MAKYGGRDDDQYIGPGRMDPETGEIQTVQDIARLTNKPGPTYNAPVAPQITTPMQLPDSIPFGLGGGRSGGGYGSPMGYQDESDQLYSGLNNFREQLIRSWAMRHWRG